MKYAREGKPPTHRQVCEARHKDTNKRFFTAEHKFPIMIPKKGIRDRGWTLEEARDWMWQHSRVTIVTQEENKRLLPFTEDMKIASKRYEEANIEVCIHPKYLAEGETLSTADREALFQDLTTSSEAFANTPLGRKGELERNELFSNLDSMTSAVADMADIKELLAKSVNDEDGDGVFSFDNYFVFNIIYYFRSIIVLFLTNL